MIIADLTDQDTGERVGRVYLATAPFPGDVIETVPPVIVLRRSFLDLGPDGNPAGRLSLNLKVRPA